MRIGIDASRAFVKNPTGTERYACEVITRILRLPEARNHTWVLYVKPGQMQSIAEADFKRMSQVKVKVIPLKYLWTQLGLAWRTWVDRLDVLWVPAHTLPVLRNPKLNTVVTIHGIEYEWLPAYENRLQRWYLPLSTKYALGQADKIIAVSEFTKKQLIERMRADPNKITTILEGFEVQDGGQSLGARDTAKIFHKYKIKSKQYLLFVGTVQPRKNLVRLIEAFSKLIHRLKKTDLKLVICGKLGWSYREVVSAPQKNQIQDRVVITDYVDNSTREILLSNALAYVQPSITEGFGLPVLEAMAAGVPVVSSRGGALSEILRMPNATRTVTPGVKTADFEYRVLGDFAGGLFDPEDVDGMADLLELAVKNPTLLREMTRRGGMQSQGFGWDKAAIETYRLLTSF